MYLCVGVWVTCLKMIILVMCFPTCQTKVSRSCSSSPPPSPSFLSSFLCWPVDSSPGPAGFLDRMSLDRKSDRMQEAMRDTCQIMSDSMSKYVSDKMADTMSE